MRVRIEGMSCAHCVMAVKKALSQLAGVERVVEVSLDRGEAVIEGRPDPAALRAALEAEGYRLASVEGDA